MSKIPEGCKPFNLQEALEGKPVVTRDGREVKIAGYNRFANAHYVIGWIDGASCGWRKDGTYSSAPHDKDLFMNTDIKDVWVAMYVDHQDRIRTVDLPGSRIDAEQSIGYLTNAGYKTLGIHKITVEL